MATEQEAVLQELGEVRSIIRKAIRADDERLQKVFKNLEMCAIDRKVCENYKRQHPEEPETNNKQSCERLEVLFRESVKEEQQLKQHIDELSEILEQNIAELSRTLKTVRIK